MRTSTSLKVLILFAGMILVMAAQWRTVSRVRHENRQLQGLRERAEQTCPELEQATQAATQLESEAQSLRTEVVELRRELQTVRFELGQATNAARQAASAPENSRSRLGVGVPSAPALSGSQPLGDRRISHMHPNALTNLVPGLPSSAFVYRAGSTLDGVELWNGITRETVLAGTPWSPSEPLPLNFTGAEEIARGELRRLTHDEPGWVLEEIRLHRLWDGGQAWHYAMQFRFPGAPSDYFTVNVGFSGAAGTTTLRDGK